MRAFMQTIQTRRRFLAALSSAGAAGLLGDEHREPTIVAGVGIGTRQQGHHIAARRMGYRVITRADSLDAMETFRAEPCKFHLVITDHTMPGLQGADLAEQMGDIRPDLPVVLMTGLNQPPDFSGSAYARRRAIFQKPINLTAHSRSLRKLLDEPAK